MSIKNGLIRQYIFEQPGTHSSLRSVLLFGRNTSTYKFALCDALLRQPARTEHAYDDLLPFFVDALSHRVRISPKQENRNEPGSLVTACIKFNAGIIDKNELLKIGAQVMPRYVFHAFQNIGRGSLEGEHSLFFDNKKRRRLELTDALLKILENPKAIEVLLLENECRWGVVEEAWRLGFNPAVISYNEDGSFIYGSDRRVSLRSAVPTLLPYQKGLCFYCCRPIRLSAFQHEDDFGDVDHCIPRSALLKIRPAGTTPSANLDGIWNLVVACKNCNRGPGGKSDQIPDLHYYEHLCLRNMRFALEHDHSLRHAVLWSLNTDRGEGIKTRMQEIWSVLPRVEGWRPKDRQVPSIEF